MSIFDQMSANDYSSFLAQGSNQQPNIFDQRQDIPMNMQPPGDQMTMNHPQGGGGMLMDETPPIMPEAPQGNSYKDWIGDPSGFANAGMQAPQLPDPTQQMGGLMNLILKQAVDQKLQQPNNRQPQGGLMAYLSQLGV
jgi:hypothetical protein